MKRDVGNDGLVRGMCVEVSTPLQNEGVVRWGWMTAADEDEVMDTNKASLLQHDTRQTAEVRLLKAAVSNVQQSAPAVQN